MTRAFNPATDFPALVELLNAAAKADDVALTTEAEQRAFKENFEKYGYFQQWVSLDANTSAFTGYAAVMKQPATPYAESMLVVHPKCREQGLENELLEPIISTAKQQNATYLYDLVDKNNKARQDFLLQQGYKLERGFRLMEFKLPTSLPTPVFPSALSLQTYDKVNDVSVIVEIANKGWSDLPGHKVVSGNNIDWVNQLPHDSIFLLFDKQHKVVGCVTATITEDGRGIVDAPALVPEYRQPELYRALVLVGLEYMARQGCTEAAMNSWGDDDSTIAAYTELGFETKIHEFGYRLDLT